MKPSTVSDIESELKEFAKNTKLDQLSKELDLEYCKLRDMQLEKMMICVRIYDIIDEMEKLLK